MLTKIEGPKLEAIWEELYPAIYDVLPEHEKIIPNLKGNLYEAMVNNQMQLWVLYDKENVKSVISTYLGDNDFTGLKELFIYSFMSFDNLTPDEYVQGMMVLNKFAVLCDCHSIGAFTDVPKLVDFVKENGGTAVTKITIPVIGG